MIRELCKDDAILSKKCQRATPEDAPLAQDLIDTLRSVEDGACLAANQIGETKAVAVYLDDNGEAHVLYNLRIMMGLNAKRTVEGVPRTTSLPRSPATARSRSPTTSWSTASLCRAAATSPAGRPRWCSTWLTTATASWSREAIVADEKNVIDLGLPAGKLFAQYPDLPGLLAEMGIEDVDAEKTLPEVAADLGRRDKRDCVCA